MPDFRLDPGRLTLRAIAALYHAPHRLHLAPESWDGIDRSAETVSAIIRRGETAYGINTGFGSLAHTRIPDHQVAELQRRLVLSHAAGTGPALPRAIAKLALLLKINALARGFSGIRRETLQALIALYNADAIPLIPAQGSVGASGDLAPLAHLTLVLLGEGEVETADRRLSGAEGLRLAGLQPITLAAKEGLALLNGTQVSAALAIAGLLRAEAIFQAAIAAGALSTDADLGSDVPFDPRIHALRGQIGQIEVAAALRRLMEGSGLRASHIDCDRVQDPYSLRCQPQVMGAILDMLRHGALILAREANAVSDNPLVFAESGDILSGGNFHAEPVAIAADAIAIAMAEIGALSERRIALLTDAKMSNLPAFLVPEPGLNSGFMIAHVTAAALASENKSLAHPASVDSLPTSANQEDHVSMATYAARRLLTIGENCAGIIAIELLAAAQGIDLRRPLATSPRLERLMQAIRIRAPFWAEDRAMAPDIAALRGLIGDPLFAELVAIDIVADPNS